MDDVKNTIKRPIATWNCKGRLISVDKPLVMGILNVTPDSFFAESRVGYTNVGEKAKAMLEQGADILDIGGQSTRPGSEVVIASEEIDRVIPAIELILKQDPKAVISIDTYYHEVAQAAVKAGALMVNDISAGELDPEMIPTVASLGVPYIMMHMKGSPQTMSEEAKYEDLTREVMDYFILKTATCRKAGIRDIVIDPGFGFAKNIQHNLTLLRNLAVFKILDLTLLVGLSRKSTIYKLLGTDADHALNGTTVMNTLALMAGADILRVHDVREAKEAIILTQHIVNAG
jgi:dihydropteroate synthase